MNFKKRGLGRGLSDLGLGALLGDMQAPPAAVENPVIFEATSSDLNNPPVDGQLKMLPIAVLVPGKYQPRKIMATEALEELASSIRKQGVIQPIVVRPLLNNQYEIIAGERRWRAAQLAELQYIPAIIRNITDETAMLMALIENIQRRDLNVIEEANALNRLMSEFNMTHQAVADAVGKSRTAITNLLRLLNLSSDVRGLVEQGQLEMGHARALLTLSDEQQNHAANIIVARSLSVRETEDLIRRMTPIKDASAKINSQTTMSHPAENQLSEKLGATVSITQNAKGRGKVVIVFQNQKELEAILARL